MARAPGRSLTSARLLHVMVTVGTASSQEDILAESKRLWRLSPATSSPALASWPTKRTREADRGEAGGEGGWWGWGLLGDLTRWERRKRHLSQVPVREVHDIGHWKYMWEQAQTNLYPSQIYILCYTVVYSLKINFQDTNLKAAIVLLCLNVHLLKW